MVSGKAWPTEGDKAHAAYCMTPNCERCREMVNAMRDVVGMPPQPDTSRARARVCPGSAEPLTIVDHGPDNFWPGVLCGALGMGLLAIGALALHGWLS